MNRKQFIKELRQYGIDNTVPNISDVNAHFLVDLLKITGSKNMLEI
jgi:predicted O-methyltransferase YrrM|tara:strand:+ start:184 stop:321 length:138 start_codon:yes stop_codon:yes gene_type:complete